MYEGKLGLLYEKIMKMYNYLDTWYESRMSPGENPSGHIVQDTIPTGK